MESEIEFDKFKIYNIEEEYSFFYKNIPTIEFIIFFLHILK